MDKGKGKRKSPPPSSVSATSLTKTAAASSLNEEAPEEISNETAYKNMCLEKKRIRESQPSNPYRCPDLRGKEKWSQKDKEEYQKWLIYKKGHLGLSRTEEESLASLVLRNPIGRRTDLDK